MRAHNCPTALLHELSSYSHKQAWHGRQNALLSVCNGGLSMEIGWPNPSMTMTNNWEVIM